MARVPQLPNPGQPIDTQYIYDIVDSLIALNTEIAQKSTSSTYIDNGSTALSAYKVSELSMSATTSKSITGNVKNNQPVDMVVPFGLNFKYAPVVTVTAVANNNNNESTHVTATITNIDQATVTFKAWFATSGGGADVSFNVVAVGIPE